MALTDALPGRARVGSPRPEIYHLDRTVQSPGEGEWKRPRKGRRKGARADNQKEGYSGEEEGEKATLTNPPDRGEIDLLCQKTSRVDHQKILHCCNECNAIEASSGVDTGTLTKLGCTLAGGVIVFVQ